MTPRAFPAVALLAVVAGCKKDATVLETFNAEDDYVEVYVGPDAFIDDPDEDAVVLRNLGILYAPDLVANAGGKGPAVTALAAGREAPVVFVDDIPHHHTSVAEHSAEAHRIHFVADERLRGLIGPADEAHARIDEWPEAADYIAAHFEAAGY